jgi:hypothetical protein
VSATVPNDATAWYLSVKDARELTVTTDHLEHTPTF